MSLESLEPRDVGFALAAVLVDREGAVALAEKAPRGAAARLCAALREVVADEGALARLRQRFEAACKSTGAVLQKIHASWLAEALLGEPKEVVEAVLRALPESLCRSVEGALAGLGRPEKRGGSPVGGIRAEIEPLLVERFVRRAFPEATALPGNGAPERAWLARAGADEIVAVARELGLKVVVRAFSRISREDLAKLCHGLAPTDSVRLVSGVVELNESLKEPDLRETQRLHLTLLRAAGISKELFRDAGFAFIGAALLAQLEEAARKLLALRLPEPLGRRLLDLSTGAALPPEEARSKFAAELPVWLGELAARGIAPSFGAAEDSAPSGEQGEGGAAA